jgi:hypothetical protein
MKSLSILAIAIPAIQTLAIPAIMGVVAQTGNHQPEIGSIQKRSWKGGYGDGYGGYGGYGGWGW